MFKSVGTYLLLSCLIILFIFGCKESSVTTVIPSTTNSSITPSPLYLTGSLFEGFESGSKAAYAAADVTLGSGVWNLNDALIGNTSSDVKNGTQSARVRNSGKITMQFNRTTGAGTVTILHAKYGSDVSTTWQLWYSTNSGTSWTQTGSTVTSSATTLQTATFTVNIGGTIRFEVRKTDGATNRTNIDDITITDFVANNPLPVLNTMSPTSCNAGSSAFTLTVNGSSFISSSVVKWNGTSLTTTYISATQLQAVPAANVASAGTASVTVFTPTPGGGTSSALTFTINSVVNNPLPVLSSISPTSCNAGSSAFTLTLNGSSFISISVAKWNGTSLATTYVSATQLQAAIPAANVATAGTASVTVFSPTPGGGTSSAKTFTINSVTPPSSNVNLTMGNPSGAVHNTSYYTNYLIERGQYCMSYNRDRGISNWVSWQLKSSWLGSASRSSFITDVTLPSGWYEVTTSDYTNTGFSRGHMCPSADRTNTQANNDSVFLMTNIIPQTQANNGGPWEQLETYCRTLANAGNVLYIISGGYGNGGTGLNGYYTTIAGGKVAVPAKTWKVIMVLPAGTNDLSRVTTSTRCIAVIMNNDLGPFNSWGTYRVSVDAVEALTGYDLFSNVSTSIQAVIEAVVDNGPTQ